MAPLPNPLATLQGDDLALYQEMLKRREAHGTGLYGPYVALMNHPRLASRIEALGGFLKFEGVLPREVYQFAVLAFAAETGNEFEWQDHVAPARAAGLPETVVEALRAKASLPQPYQDLRDLMRIVMQYRSLPQDLQDRVVAQVGIPGLLELVALCGVYALIGYVNNAFDIPVERKS